MIKHFAAVINPLPLKARVFDTTSKLHTRLQLAGNIVFLPYLAYPYSWKGVDVTDSKKCSSLMQEGLNYGHNYFFDTDPCTLFYWAWYTHIYNIHKLLFKGLFGCDPICFKLI